MSKFIKEQFNYDGMYLTYGPDRKFVARFKRGGQADFKRFLVQNFTVDEYFAQLADSAPLTVLMSKGYESPAVRKARQLGQL
jgi:hypothetical protein